MISTLHFLEPKVSFLIVGPKNSLGCIYLSSRKRASFLRILVAFSSRISNFNTIGFFLLFLGFSANFFSFSLTSGLRLTSLVSDKVSYALVSPSDVKSFSLTVFSVLFNSSSFFSVSSFSFSASSSPFFSAASSLSFSSSSSVAA